jgi:hypothetical protein
MLTRAVPLSSLLCLLWLQPFFEADLPGCVLRIVPNLGPNAQRSQQPGYMLVRIDGVVSRNSYM